MSSSAPPDPGRPPVDSDGRVIGDVPWKFFEPPAGDAAQRLITSRSGKITKKARQCVNTTGPENQDSEQRHPERF